MGNKRDADIFNNELVYLHSAKNVLKHREQYADNELLPHFEQLVQNYERLIKLTTKVFRISDIQGENVKRQESEIRRYNEHLQQMEMSRRRLIADISHELGTPMTSIQGYLKAMLDNVIVPEPKYLQMIYNKTVLIHQLVEDLFEMSKLESNLAGMEFEDMAVEDLFALFRSKFELEIKDRGYRFVMEKIQGMPDSACPVVSIDLVRIEQVMNNLISNAFKYTPTGGDIVFQCEVDAKKSLCTFSISDSGPGIDESAIAHVFERFFRGDKSKHKQAPGGSGLGLAIAQEIIKKHGGFMDVRSKAGEGATFSFMLPITLLTVWGN